MTSSHTYFLYIRSPFFKLHKNVLLVALRKNIRWVRLHHVFQNIWQARICHYLKYFLNQNISNKIMIDYQIHTYQFHFIVHITIKQYKIVNKMHIADQCTKCCIQDKSIRRIIILDTKSILRTSHKRKKFYKLRPRKTMKHGIKRNLITNNRS